MRGGISMRFDERLEELRVALNKRYGLKLTMENMKEWLKDHRREPGPR